MANVDTIEYITFASTGNSADFGDLASTRQHGIGGCGDGTKGIFMGGQVPGDQTDAIDYVNIASTGDATDFGNLTTTVYGKAASSGD